jgi:hypothetical protein
MGTIRKKGFFPTRGLTPEVIHVDEMAYFNGDKGMLTNFIDYLKDADPNETYYFTEPDSRIEQIFPPLTTDLALLYRTVPPHIPPAWRLAKKKSLPIFEEVFDDYNTNNKTWNSDSNAWNNFFTKLDLENEGKTIHNNITIELRSYKHYCTKKGKYVSQFKGKSKSKLLDRENL